MDDRIGDGEGAGGEEAASNCRASSENSPPSAARRGANGEGRRRGPYCQGVYTPAATLALDPVLHWPLMALRTPAWPARGPATLQAGGEGGPCLGGDDHAPLAGDGVLRPGRAPRNPDVRPRGRQIQPVQKIWPNVAQKERSPDCSMGRHGGGTGAGVKIVG